MLRLTQFSSAYDWSAINLEMADAGAVILKEFVDVDELNAALDAYVSANPGVGLPDTGSAQYDNFLGHQTLRLHGLIDKVPAVTELIGHTDLVRWAEASMADIADSVLLSAAEVIQIQPGEAKQLPHRDTDSWPMVRGEVPFVVNAIIALSEFTEDNGATHVVPGSWRWAQEQRAETDEFLQAVMSPGDAVLFRGDLLHGGGANSSNGPRRALSISYCAGWLRPVENNLLNVSIERVAELPREVQNLVGFRAHDGGRFGSGMVGLFENGDPRVYLNQLERNQ